MAQTLQMTDTARATFKALKKAAKAAEKARKQSKKTSSSNQEGLYEQVVKTLKHLKENPRHPGLQTHKYDAIANPVRKNESVFEAYAQNQTPGAYRVFWCYGPAQTDITIIAITPHP